MTQPDSTLRLVSHRKSCRIWDGAVVVFDPLSGDTHRIDPPSGDILALLAESPSSIADIHSALSSVVSAENAEKIKEALDLLLAMELLESS